MKKIKYFNTWFIRDQDRRIFLPDHELYSYGNIYGIHTKFKKRITQLKFQHLDNQNYKCLCVGFSPVDSIDFTDYATRFIMLRYIRTKNIMLFNNKSDLHNYVELETLLS